MSLILYHTPWLSNVPKYRNKEESNQGIYEVTQLDHIYQSGYLKMSDPTIDAFKQHNDMELHDAESKL